MKTQIFKLTAFPFILILALSLSMTSCSTEPVGTSNDLYEDTDSSEDLIPEPEVSVTTFEKEVFDAVNTHRQSLGLATLEFSGHAYLAAEEHSKYMIDKGVLSHNNFGNRAKQISEATGAQAVAENVARNYDSAKAVLDAWLASPSHKKTLEGDFSHQALSVEMDENGNPYYTNIFFKK